MSSVSGGSTQIRIDLDVKAKLESFKDALPGDKITHSYAIEKLMNYYGIAERQKIEDKQTAEAEKKRRGLEDVSLGESRKKFLVANKEKYGFSDLNALIDTLLLNYEIIKDFQEKHELPNLDGMLKALFGLYEQTDMLSKETVKLLYSQR